MTQFQNTVYFVIFIFMVVITTIIFLNFIIAEVSATYENVKQSIHVQLMQERGGMINEAEDILRARFGDNKMKEWKHLFPKYIITREMDQWNWFTI